MMPITRAGASPGGDDDSGIDESTSQQRESRALTQTNIEQLIQVFRALRTDFQPYQPIHDPIDTT